MPDQLLPFTVIGHYEDNAQLFAEHVMAFSGMHAFGVLSQADDEDAPTRLYTMALPGFLADGTDFVMPGESLVYDETVREQPDVFGPRSED